MFPHPETVNQVRDTERRLQLDRLARERAAMAKVAAPAGRGGRIGPHRILPLPPMSPRGLGRLPLAWIAAAFGAANVPRLGRKV